MMMKVAFRVDASLQMGSGHVMRCLTLADALTVHGVECLFVSRALAGNLHDLMRQRGFEPLVLPDLLLEGQAEDVDSSEPTHASWLGCGWRHDAAQTDALLSRCKPDWLVVDHYALDAQWEFSMRSACQRLMVIDDLADRNHHCDLLLDQNLGRNATDYVQRVPLGSQILTGTQYTLLRPQFAELRNYSLHRRSQRVLRNILVTMGGVDQQNATQQVLAALRECTLPKGCMVTIVMGQQAPWLDQVREFAAGMACATEVLVNISDMAQRMADSDLAIGAAGSTAWERCCLGLPSLMVVLADNQRSAAEELERAGAAYCVTLGLHLRSQLSQFMALFAGDAAPVFAMSTKASELVDGEGVERVLSHMLNIDRLGAQ